MKRTLLLTILILLLLSFGGCKKVPSKTTVEEEGSLKTFKVSTSGVTTYIEATGSVQPDLQGSSKILPYLSGTVHKIFVKPGDRVAKGDALATVLCPEVTDTYSAYLSALSQLTQAERIYNLNSQLFEVGAVTKNDLLNSEATKRQLTAVLDGMRSKLRIYGYSMEGETAIRKPASDTVTIKAPMNGYIADVQTHVGDKVDGTSPIMTIADPENILIVANIYDTDVPKVKKGSKVTFYTDVFRNVQFEGTITYVSDISDQDAKTVKTYIKLVGGKEYFKQNMFLKLMIEHEKKLLPMIPQSAMVYREGKFYVYCPVKGKGKMCEIKEIKPFREVSGKYMAVEGLEEGQEIVLSAIELEKP